MLGPGPCANALGLPDSVDVAQRRHTGRQAAALSPSEAWTWEIRCYLGIPIWLASTLARTCSYVSY